MSKQEQQKLERKVFLEFVRKSGLDIDEKTLKSREPPEPDLRCLVRRDDYVAFELKEICDEEVAKWTADLFKNPPPDDADEAPFKWLRDFSTSSNDIAKWLKKHFSNKNKYQTDCPMELLLYVDGRTSYPDENILADIEDNSELLTHIFGKVWFMGEKVCGCAIPNEIESGWNKKYSVSVYQEGKPRIIVSERIPKLFDNRKDAIQAGKEFATANPSLFPPEDGAVSCSWMVVDEEEQA